MCGIGGIVGSKLLRDEIEERLLSMQRALHHRGPDDQGLFISQGANAGLAATRLAILDLSPAGHQPMTSPDGRFTIAFNGEVYNYGALRAELLVNCYSLRSHSDTEVVLELFARDGARCVERLDGMFALAIWDDEERSLFLARDPLGIKPLYYFTEKGTLCFASEIRALLKSGLVPQKVSPGGTRGYLMSGSVPEPDTLVENVHMLPAGHYLTWADGKATLTKYWEIDFGNAERGMRSPRRNPTAAEAGNAELEGRALPSSRKHSESRPGLAAASPSDRDEAVRVTRAALDESIERHLVSDVPVGVFLSGGIDSTTLVALASQKTKEPLRTFSISFDDLAFDEGVVAARTAAHFKTKHTDWRLDSATAKNLLEEFLERSDQPTIDGFNTFCVSKMAHDHGLKVVLSGLGGDELFGGYPSFATIPRMLKRSRQLQPVAPLRKAAGRLLELTNSPRTRRLGSFLKSPPEVASAYQAMRGVFTAREAERLLPGYVRPGSTPPATTGVVPVQPTLEDEISYLELTRYMRNQLLRDSDVMSMAWSLELRVPFVDRKLIETVAKIPARWRLARGKQMLLDAVPEIPEWVRNRPKQGFTFPFKDWVTSEWKDVFQRIEEQSPVPLQNWYRTWCLFALEKFLEKLKPEKLKR